MKVLVITQYPIFASTSNRMLGFACGLAKRGHIVTYLVIGNKYLSNEKKRSKLPNIIDDVRIKYTISLPDMFIKTPGIISGLFAMILLFIAKLPIVICYAFRNDVLYSSKPLPYGASISWIASFISRTPYVLDTDDWEGVGGFATVKQANRAFIKAAITYFEEKMPLLASSIVTASQLLADRILLSGVSKEKIWIIPNGADLTIFKAAVSGERIRKENGLSGVVFIYVGTFKMGGANWRMLIDAFHYAYNIEKTIKLLIIGYGDQLADAQRYCQEKELGENIIFTGKINHNEVPNYIAAADVCLLPYQDSFPHTFINIGRSSIKLYEYMAMGKAIIGTNVGEVSAALEHGAGVLVPSCNDPIAFGKAMVELIQNPIKINQLGNEARRRTEMYYNYYSLSERLQLVLMAAISKR